MNNQELIRQIVKVGNGAGVVLPRQWYGGKARIELLEKPLDIKKDILEILDSYMENVMGIYLAGSYARGQQKDDSDVDVLVVTYNINKKITKGKYEILLISRDNLKNTLKNNVLPILPMLRESKVILNKDLISEYAKTLLTKQNMKWHIETTKSAMKIAESSISISKEGNENCGDEVSYSLTLRLREIYIVNCLIKNKLWSNKELISLMKKICGSDKAYNGYLRVKKNIKSREELPIEEANKLMIYISNEIKNQEKWLTKKD